MKPNAHRSDRIAARSGCKLAWRSPVLRCGVFIVVAAFSAGCSNDVVV
jgi:hypothetical protein